MVVPAARMRLQFRTWALQGISSSKAPPILTLTTSAATLPSNRFNTFCYKGTKPCKTAITTILSYHNSHKAHSNNNNNNLSLPLRYNYYPLLSSFSNSNLLKTTATLAALILAI